MTVLKNLIFYLIKMEKIKIPDTCKYISVFLSMRCNLNCSFCLNAFDKSFNRRRFEEIPGEAWIKALNRIESRSEVPITFSGGEPFIHKDFIDIANNLDPNLNIDILTNLYPNSTSHKNRLDRFLEEVNPKRIKRDSPYASIRVSYHPEQMDADTLIKNVKRFQDKGFSIGIWAVLYSSSKQLSAINQMQFRCKDAGIEFRLKEFTGKYKGELYGNYSKYPESVFQEKTKSCSCKTSELLIGPNANVYRCHRDLYAEENSIGNLTDPDFRTEGKFRPCDKYGQCHPCDVKIKTNYKQQLGHTSVEIKNVRE